VRHLNCQPGTSPFSSNAFHVPIRPEGPVGLVKNDVGQFPVELLSQFIAERLFIIRKERLLAGGTEIFEAATIRAAVRATCS
jgi:hypothetical protein